MPIVFNISREGYDADTTDLNKLVVSSLGKELKITQQKQGSILIPSAGSSAEKKIHHGLAYEPAFLSYFEYPDDPGRWWVSGTLMGNLGLSDYDSDSRVDKEHLILGVNRGESAEVGDKTIDYAYMLFDQPAAYIAGGDGEPIGYTKDTHGIVVSEEGIDADTAPLYKQQFNSNTDFLKYHFTKEGKAHYDNSVNGATTINITHNLGYIPVFMMYGGSTEDPFYSAAPLGKSPVPFIASAGATKTNVTINLVWAGGGSGSEDFLYRVVIFKNRMVI